MLSSFRMPTLAASFATSLTLLTLSACASGGAPAASLPAPAASVRADSASPRVATAATGASPAAIRGSVRAPETAARRDRQVLSRDEIRATQFTNAYDVILALRGNWLRSRTAESVSGKSSTVQVYLDQQRLTGVEELRTMQPTNIASIRFMDPVQASARYGMDHGAGAILVTTAKP